MKIGWLILILFSALLAAGQCYAQAFDPNCYRPRIGIEIDTLTGPPFFGYDLFKLEDDSSGNEMISFYPGVEADPQVIYSSGKLTDIHNLSVRKTWNINVSNAIFGNFHSTKVKDAFDPETNIIYWADDEGNFDSSRFTELRSSVQGNLSPETGGGFSYELLNPYVAKLTSDSLDDIVMLGATRWKTLQEYKDSSRFYLLLFMGANLYHIHGEIALSDSVFQYAKYSDTIYKSRRGTAGNFRGTGRIDLIATDYYGNFFYFKNEPPFSMQNLIEGIFYDTLSAVWQNPNWVEDQGNAYLTRKPLRAFYKPTWDKSVDFIGRFITNDYRAQSYLFFRGGPSFGSQRITLDSAEFVLRSPALLDGSFQGMSFGFGIECGDMTGTGNPVVMGGGGFGHGPSYDLFYVLGKAIDEKADIYIEYPVSGSGYPIEVRADNDNLQDILFQINNYNLPSLDPVSGSIAMLQGTNKIPVTLNPKYAVEERNALMRSTNNLLAVPNPFEQKTVLTFDNCSDGRMYMEVVNSLGKVMFREDIVDVNGLQQYSADLSMLVPGAYHIRLVCPADGWSATVNVVKTGW